jgi:hypothetical protein
VPVKSPAQKAQRLLHAPHCGPIWRFPLIICMPTLDHPQLPRHKHQVHCFIIFVLLTAFTPGTIYDAVEEACFVLQVLLYKFKAALKPLSWTVLIKSPGAASKHLKLPSRYLLCNKYCVT